MARLDVLAVDDEGDAHGQAVIEELLALGLRAARYNLADLNRHLIIVRPGVVDLVIDGHDYQVTAATTVWWRRQGWADISHLDDEEAQLAHDEGPHILRGALQSAGVRWVDDPSVVDRAELKLFQLQAASNLGIRVPDSVATNDLAAARQFTAARPCVAKALSPGFGITPYTDTVTNEDLDRVAQLPALLQEEVTASADLRVVVIGSSAWVWRRLRDGTVLDWRAEDASGSDFRVTGDPEVLNHACQVTSALGLTMSVQDWLETDSGPVFLESNAQGNWMFLNGARAIVAPALAQHIASRGQSDSGHWPPAWKRMLYDFLPKGLAPNYDGARAPRFSDPAWAREVAARPGAVDVVRRAADEASSGAVVAEGKASRLVQVSLSVLTIAFVVGGIQLPMAIEEHSLWWLMVLPVSCAVVCLTISAFQALQADRVGFYDCPSGESLAALGVADPVARIVAEEEIGRQYAQWTSDHKHTDLMQARAWFTRGLTALILAAILMLTLLLTLRDVPTDTCDAICSNGTEEG